MSRKTKRLKRLSKLYDMNDNKCAHCGLVDDRLGFYDFHHINPEDKTHNVGRIMLGKWELLVAEVEKCVMLCPNCHRKEHIRLREEEYDYEFEHGITDSRMG